jgi:hypothetical protein
MVMDAEERELTILITQLNANLQIQLTQTLGLLAVSVAFFVASYQFLMQNSLRPLNYIIFGFLFTLSLAFLYSATRFQQKLNLTMKKIGELK